MPLSAPVPRQTIHDRHVHCAGFHRDDGLWDIEGHLRDTNDSEVVKAVYPKYYTGT